MKLNYQKNDSEFERLLKKEMRGLVKNVKKEFNIYIFGDQEKIDSHLRDEFIKRIKGE